MEQANAHIRHISTHPPLGTIVERKVDTCRLISAVLRIGGIAESGYASVSAPRDETINSTSVLLAPSLLFLQERWHSLMWKGTLTATANIAAWLNFL